VGVVTYEDRALTSRFAHCLAHRAEDMIQRFALDLRCPKRVPGIDPGDLEGAGIDARTGKGLDMGRNGLARKQSTVDIHVNHDGADFEQRIGGGLEASGLDIDHDRQEAAEAVSDP
jgi:hypothetical protein